MSTASAWEHEAGSACPSVPEAPISPSAQGFGAHDRMAGPSVAAVAGLVSASADAAMHDPAEPEPAERQPEPAQSERDGALAGLLADAHAAAAQLPAPVQLAASSLVRSPCNPALRAPGFIATTVRLTVLEIKNHCASLLCPVHSCQGASHDNK